MNEVLLTIISSSAISVILGAVIAGYYSLRSKRNEYVNEYYKTVINRRIYAYEQLETLIIGLKSAVLDDDNRPYHLIFGIEKANIELHLLIGNVLDQGLWISNEAFQRTRDLNCMILNLHASDGVEWGKWHYKEISDLRVDLETILARDLLTLYDVHKFLSNKQKKINNDFGPIEVKPPIRKELANP